MIIYLWAACESVFELFQHSTISGWSCGLLHFAQPRITALQMNILSGT